MNNKYFIIGLLVLVFGVALYFAWLFNNSQNKVGNTNTVSSDSHVAQDQLKNPGWEKAINTGYTMEYPPSAKALTINEDGHIETVISFMGPKQEEFSNTEFFDGYSFSIRDITFEVEDGIKDFATLERDNAENNCLYEEGSVSQLKSIATNNAQGFQFIVEGCSSINFAQTFLSSNGKHYRVSQSYVGEPDDYEVYKNTTTKMLNSLVFLE